MLSFDLESNLLEPVANYQRRKTFRRQYDELPFYEYRIDLFGFSQKLGSTVAVELKLSKWKRAFEQASIYQLCADFVYIALPSINIAKVDISLLQENGIGLISVFETGRCRQIIEPLPSPVVRPHYRDHYIDLLMGTE
ncbi:MULTISPECIES: hypothetical protein [Gimesia]|uniref:TnsA endonuclease N-terminal domain-containing protein n=1 Tax=Gimesia maris TaxID=122 RepID=A0ABX5YQ58_9PLAN|nr:hypothetical protein [Gimesia maris]EDL60380.1 hypothetical protein PM8797T_25321 [Gimesia maris DSM 8797]QEG17854.1 hypothetical protein GmarT_37380 [Gimesia maris]QGQ29112.1 hypothetical protein F1729_10870 [Gimesia maris]